MADDALIVAPEFDVESAAMLMAANDINPTTPVGDVFEASDITVNLKRVGQTSARLGVEEPRAFKVLRSELLGSEEAA